MDIVLVASVNKPLPKNNTLFWEMGSTAMDPKKKMRRKFQEKGDRFG